jgi:micrococcal nuclease
MKDEGLYRYSANVTSVYDADTCTVDIDLGLGIWLRKQKLRFFGINAPEMRGPEKARGKISRDFCRQLIDKKRIIFQSVRDGKGKYGRYLAILWLEYQEGEWLNVNDLLVARGYAIAKVY